MVLVSQRFFYGYANATCCARCREKMVQALTLSIARVNELGYAFTPKPGCVEWDGRSTVRVKSAIGGIFLGFDVYAIHTDGDYAYAVIDPITEGHDMLEFVAMPQHNFTMRAMPGTDFCEYALVKVTDRVCELARIWG